MFHLPARSIVLAALSATLLIAANPLAAAETRSIAVQSSDLNLARSADRITLQQRIAHAVDGICGSAHGRTTADVQAYATCSKTARAGVSVQYDAMIAKAQMNTKMASDRKNTTAAQ
jgi:UrcA family protein